MFKLENSIVTDAPVEKVFAYLVDPAHMPEYMPDTDEVKDVQRLPDGRYTYTGVSKFLGLHMDWKTEQVEVIPNQRIVQKMRGTGMDGVSTITLEPLEGGKTRATLITETTLHAGPLARFGEAVFEKYFAHAELMSMEAAKAHIEAGALAASPS